MDEDEFWNEIKLKELDFWRLCDDLSIVQASLLILGLNPEKHFGIERKATKPEGYEAVKTAITNAAELEKLPAKLHYESYEGPFSNIVHDLVLEESLISVQDIKQWLSSRNLYPLFFFPDGNNSPTYLDSGAKYYAPKLAAALNAWEAVTKDEAQLKSQSPKKALKKWLREHAVEYGLNKEDGTLNESAIEEIAKIANWQPAGGAPKTPENSKADPE